MTVQATRDILERIRISISQLNFEINIPKSINVRFATHANEKADHEKLKLFLKESTVVIVHNEIVVIDKIWLNTRDQGFFKDWIFDIELSRMSMDLFRKLSKLEISFEDIEYKEEER